MQYVHTSKKGKKGRKSQPPAPSYGSSPTDPSRLPDRLMTFAEPLLDVFAGPKSADLLRRLFSLAALAWNEGHPAHVLPLRDTLRLRDRLMREFGSTWSEVEPIYQQLVRTRSEQWSEDQRLITECRLLEGPEGKLELLVAGEDRR